MHQIVKELLAGYVVVVGMLKYINLDYVVNGEYMHIIFIIFTVH